MASQSPTQVRMPSRQGGIGSSTPQITTPFWSRTARSTVSVSPSASHSNPAASLERDIQTRGFGHKTWRVREMVLEWLITCVQQYPDFPAARYIANAFTLLDDNHDAVRFAAKRALNTIYHAHTELQEDIIAKAQSITPHRPTLLSAITALPGELSAMPSSPYGGMRSSSRVGSAMGMRPGSRISGARADSRIAQPSFLPQIPGTGGLRNGSGRVSQQGFRPGSRLKENWNQREKAVCLYRGIIWGNAAVEFHGDLATLLKEHIHELLKAVESLRTSLSSHAMGLCEDISIRLGPHVSTIVDVIVDALLKQCAQTKKIGAQRASKSLEVVYRHFPLRPKAIDTLKLRMSDKSATIRHAIVTVCSTVLRSHRTQLGLSDRRNTDVLSTIGDVTRAGVSDSQPSVREASRELFWELYMTSALHANHVNVGFPDNIRAALNRDKARYVLNDKSTSSMTQTLQDSRPTSAASTFRPASRTYGRPAPLRPSFSSSRESIIPGLMSVASGNSPQGPTSSERLMTYDSTLVDVQIASSPIGPNKLDEQDEGNNEENEGIIPAEITELHISRGNIRGLETPVKTRTSLGLIDFNQIDADRLPVNNNTPSKRFPGFSTEDAKEKPVAEAADGNNMMDVVFEESQATTIAVDSAVDDIASQMSTLPIHTDCKSSDEMCVDEPLHHASKEDQSMDPFGASRELSAKAQTITPEQSPGMLPRMQPKFNGLHAATSIAQNAYQQMVTPRTQTARYWHGPLEPAAVKALNGQPVIESPMPADTPQRLTKIAGYLSRLEANNEVNEALFRSLARFAKEESSGVWSDKDNGGHGYLGRILSACLMWLQNPAESRDTVFTKDSCFDVLRVLVRRKSQYFTLENARLLLLETLRNRFFESTILSGSAEDVFYDIATHLDVDLCFELVEDFFKRAPLPLVQDLASQKPGYAVRLEPAVPTATDIDPMGVYKMDNALAGMLEFAAEVVKRLPASSILTEQELDRFMPYSILCFVHPRTQVRKAALAPLIVVHEKLGLLDIELEKILLHASSSELASSTNPLAKYVSGLHRPELRRLAWTFYLSQKSK
ncbi:suppressor of tub2 mutation [Coemansia sp. RSA 1200]|nr:suppressor of tub2 mutation [Coemansia sp. RSA 1200]